MATIIVPQSTPQLTAVLDRLDALGKSYKWSPLGKYNAQCPAHDDHEPSMVISIGDDGKILLSCHGGCDFKKIVAALGLKESDLFPDVTVATLAMAKGLPPEYLESLGVYQDGKQVVIPYSHPDGTKARPRIRKGFSGKDSLWGGKGEIVPYGLDKLGNAQSQKFLLLVEGETDCWCLWYNGFPAIGVPGATNHKVLQDSYFDGIDTVYVVQENDSAGKAFSDGCARKLKEFSGQKKLVVIPKAFGDHADIRSVWGHCLKIAYEGSKEVTGYNKATDTYFTKKSGNPGEMFVVAVRKLLELAVDLPDPDIWRPAVWDARTAGQWAESTDEKPEALVEGLIYPAAMHLLVGPTGIGKTYLGMQLAAAVAAGKPVLGRQVRQAKVLYLNLELPQWELSERFKKLLELYNECKSDFVCVNARGLDLVKPEDKKGLLEQIMLYAPGLLFVDTISRVHSADENEAAEVALVIGALEEVAATLQCGVVMVHHTRKSGGDRIRTIEDSRGSSVFTNNSSVVMVITPPKEDDSELVYTIKLKSNFDAVDEFKIRRAEEFFEPYIEEGWSLEVVRKYVLSLKSEYNEYDLADHLADVFGKNPKTVRNALLNWRKDNLIPHRQERPNRPAYYGTPVGYKPKYGSE